ncbi:dihydrolipoamide acetyltransferase family protein [Saccharibacillus endophyticus]|uniref:Dihydrolipoamide acetyltransferase component of pyruvate dehydrogenase complex n=1 Tax=Saccharibacillus endophyticus TaxID=2060666 RepID=A0ABQ1ZQG8_9BACL|nr:dihydrolipoamide acetyltransferase family protein [Saccharibacillus endophyticus]GGH72403.1 lipoamide acyltransferase component of branched-chain alpha-keto acid dehydrogenase complex [Saccharibacillus endophyticus]
MSATNSTQKEITMPQLAESLVSATIAKWLKRPGDAVDMYEPICEVITDKVNAEIPSTEEGVMGELLASEGQEIAVGEIICRIITEGEAAAAAPAPQAASDSVSHAAPAAQASASRPASLNGTAAAASSESGMRARYSPAVQALAAQHNVDPAVIPGSGMGGRVTRKDVLQYVERGGASQTSAPADPVAQSTSQPTVISSGAPQPPIFAAPSSPQNEVRHSGLHLSENPPLPKIEIEDGGRGSNETYIDITPIRNTIATRMRQSVSEIPHGWMMIEVDMTNLVKLRNTHKDEFKRKEGVNLTYPAFVIKAVVNAIKDYPIMNSVWAVDKIIVKRDINISLAVGTEDSVLTPVIKKADQKNIAGLAMEIDDLARRTRERTLKLDDMQGGTFTVNNTGSFGSILSQPIINYPQAAQLTFESIVKRPVVINDMVGVRSMANFCLSLDHRILDGLICGRFLQRVKENLEGYSAETKLY